VDEVTALADRVLLLESGKLVVDAPPEELEQRLGRPVTLHLYISQPGIDPAMEMFSRHGFAASVNGRGVRVNVAPGQKGHVLRLLHEAGVAVSDFTVE
jgi:ABC-type multidrug transport system ATPase subunit